MWYNNNNFGAISIAETSICNLYFRYFLLDKKIDEPWYYGRRFKPYVPQGYMSGGAGYVLSKKALEILATNGLDNPTMCRSDAGGAEDLEVGKCMEKVGVKAGMWYIYWKSQPLCGGSREKMSGQGD